MTKAKKIFETFFLLLGLFMCGIGLFLLISKLIENPTYVPCYVGAIFLVSVAVVILFITYITLNLPVPSKKPKPKTFSEYVAIWCIVVIYVCGLGAALLWWGVTVIERLRGLMMAFAIIVSIIGGAALGGLFWLLIIRRKNKFVLKCGIETEATYIDSCPAFSVHSGKDIGGTTIFHYYITFKYMDGEKEVTVKSHSLYSQVEAKYFEQAGKFFVKYIGKRAVISQLPEEIIGKN